MFLAALINLGVDVELVKEEIKKLPFEGYSIEVTRESRAGISGLRFVVDDGGGSKEHPHRKYAVIRAMITESFLSDGVKRISLKIFDALAEAEAKVHSTTPEEVSFHEVGAVDSIIDIVGAAVALDSLDVECVVSSSVPTGSGFVMSAHGRLPVPAPATLELLRGVLIAPSVIVAELTTPTGAAIIKALVERQGSMPEMVVKKIGTGVGSKDFKGSPNILRAIIGEAGGLAASRADENVLVMETNIDDTSPEVAGFMMERLFEAGALDVFFTPVTMKKSRPGMLISVLAKEGDEGALLGIIFSESTTIGVRCYKSWRHILDREVLNVSTSYGSVRVKVSYRDGAAINFQPEYEDVKRLAMDKAVAFREVFTEARVAALEEIIGEGKVKAKL
jgi:uncharacterized protein (TIGR00299 family) protein